MESPLSAVRLYKSRFLLYYDDVIVTSLTCMVRLHGFIVGSAWGGLAAGGGGCGRIFSRGLGRGVGLEFACVAAVGGGGYRGILFAPPPETMLLPWYRAAVLAGDIHPALSMGGRGQLSIGVLSLSIGVCRNWGGGTLFLVLGAGISWGLLMELPGSSVFLSVFYGRVALAVG